MPIPDFIKKHKPVNTEIKYINKTYYVYKITSKRDSVTKKPKKVSGQCIGKITERDGFVSNGKSLTSLPISNKEYGAFTLFDNLSKDILESLKTHFSEKDAVRIYCIAMLRIISSHKIAKCLDDEYTHSFMSEVYKDVHLSRNSVSEFLNLLGSHKENLLNFMVSQINLNSTYLVFDGTAIFNDSTTNGFSKLGRNCKEIRYPQLSLIYAFSLESGEPIFYKIFAGNIIDKAAFVNVVAETGIKNSIIIADKGFYSKNNIKFLDDFNICYVIPLSSSNKMVAQYNDESQLKDYFLFDDTVIKCLKIQLDVKKHIYVFKNTKTAQYEENEYLKRILSHPDKYTLDKYETKKNLFGVIVLYSNIDESSEKAYRIYKERWHIETMFDALKNDINIATVSVQGQYRLEGWAFINHISMLMYYRLLYKLKQHQSLLQKYSAIDIIRICKYLTVVHHNAKWNKCNVTLSEKEIFNYLLGIDISDAI